MTTARDIMTPDPQPILADQTLAEAALLMRDLDVGSLPVRDATGRLRGMLTDRDIVVKCIAAGGDPTVVTAAELAEGAPVTVGVGDDIREALRLMQEQQVRRLPVLDGDEIVGIISQADIALSLSATETGETVEEISE